MGYSITVNVSEDGKTMTLDGTLPPQATRQVKALMEQYNLTTEQAVQALLRIGVRYQIQFDNVTDGRHRGNTREIDIPQMIAQVIAEVREEASDATDK